jgi:hypothetical protein
MAIGRRRKKMNFNDPNIRLFAGRPVNIKDYYTNFPNDSEYVINKQKKATFVKYGWLDISSYTLDDPRLNNLAVRSNQNLGDRHEQIAHSYDVEGWDVGQFPPIVGTDENPRDGRNRIRAALKRGEKAIPCAIYSYEDNTSVRSNTTNGLVANKHKSQMGSEFYDFVNAGVEIIQNGEMSNTTLEIEKWLYDEADVTFFFNNTGGTITKIVNTISERAERLKDGHLVILREREDWLDWLNNSINKHSAYYRNNFSVETIDDIDVLIESGGSRDEQAWMRHILPNAAKGKVTNIVLYTKEIFPEVASQKHKNFVDSLDRYYRQTFEMVNNEFDGITINVPLISGLWNIVGIAPQILNDSHTKMLGNYTLADISAFPIQDKIGKALKLVA